MKNTMNKLTHLLVLLIACAAFPSAATASPTAEEREQRMAQIVERLDLTDEQREQVRPIMKNSAKQRRAILDKHGVGPGQPKPDRQTKRAIYNDMQPVRAETEQQLATVLSDEQMEEFRQIRQELRDEWRARAREQRQ